MLFCLYSGKDFFSSNKKIEIDGKYLIISSPYNVLEKISFLAREKYKLPEKYFVILSMYNILEKISFLVKEKFTKKKFQDNRGDTRVVRLMGYAPHQFSQPLNCLLGKLFILSFLLCKHNQNEPLQLFLSMFLKAYIFSLG